MRNTLRAWATNEKLILYVGFCSLILLALILRVTFLKFQSDDYVLDLSPWYDFLKLHGFHGLKNSFSNYNMPYLYLIYLATWVPISKIVIIKAISIFFDLVLAYSVFLVVREFHPKNYLPHLAALITLFLPTVFINSSLWAQSDSIYTAFLVLSFYFLLKQDYLWMWFMWATAFDFKLQAIFFLPVLCIVGLRHQLWSKIWVCIPVLIAAILPALAAGRSLASVLQIYTSQVGFYHSLTMHAPNLYQWIPDQYFDYFNHPGMVLTVAIVGFIALIIYYYGRYNKQELVLMSLLILLVVPFFLPQMHERYFYPAEIFSLLAAFIYRPAIWYVPLIQFVTFCAYTPFLFKVQPVLPLGVVAIFLLIIISHLSYKLLIEGNGATAIPRRAKLATSKTT